MIIVMNEYHYCATVWRCVQGVYILHSMYSSLLMQGCYAFMNGVTSSTVLGM